MPAAALRALSSGLASAAAAAGPRPACPPLAPARRPAAGQAAPAPALGRPGAAGLVASAAASDTLPAGYAT